MDATLALDVGPGMAPTTCGQVPKALEAPWPVPQVPLPACLGNASLPRLSSTVAGLPRFTFRFVVRFRYRGFG